MRDQLGVVCSGLCVLHCLLSPVIIGMGLTGVLATFFTQELFHQIIIIPTLIFMSLTLPQAYKRRNGAALVLLGSIGASLLLAALFFDEKYEVVLSVLGGASIIVYHILNVLLQRKALSYQEVKVVKVS